MIFQQAHFLSCQLILKIYPMTQRACKTYQLRQVLKNLAYTTFHNFSPWQNTHLFANKIREALVKYLKPITITKKHIQGDTSPFCTPNRHQQDKAQMQQRNANVQWHTYLGLVLLKSSLRRLHVIQLVFLQLSQIHLAIFSLDMSKVIKRYVELENPGVMQLTQNLPHLP